MVGIFDVSGEVCYLGHCSDGDDAFQGQVCLICGRTGEIVCGDLGWKSSGSCETRPQIF
jgi:hypothetical protein